MSVDRVELLELDVDTRLASLWALIDSDEEWSLPLAAAYMRAAYGMGYTDALGEDVRGRLCREHNYDVPKRRGT